MSEPKPADGLSEILKTAVAFSHAQLRLAIQSKGEANV